MTDIPTTTWTPEFEAVIGASHTQGPWAVSGVRYRMNGGEWQNISSYDAVAKRDVNIAAVSIDPLTLEGIADARLIAAAPELLAALIALVDSFEKHRPKELWDAARAAISHATPKENERGN